MNRIREKLQETLSGAVLWSASLLLQALLIVIIFAPLAVIDMSWILRFIILVAVWGSMRYMPTISSIARLALWIISIWYVQGIPTLWGRIYYYVCAGLYIIFEIIPFLINLFAIIFPGGAVMKIQPRHFNSELAPMKWYKFLIWFALPAGALGNIYYAFSSVSQYFTSEYPLSTVVNGISFGTLLGIDIFFYLLCIALDIAALILLRRMDWRGVLALCWFYLAAAVYSGVCVYIYAVLGGDYGMYIGRIIVFLLWGFLTWVYFCKRRPLFHISQPRPSTDQPAPAPDRESDKNESAMKTQWEKEQNERIADMNIPNPYRPGTYFSSVDDLQEYSNAIWAPTGGHKPPSEQPAPAPETAPDKHEGTKEPTNADKGRYFIVDTNTGEVVGETNSFTQSRPPLLQRIKAKIKSLDSVRVIEAACSIVLIVVVVSAAVLYGTLTDRQSGSSAPPSTAAPITTSAPSIKTSTPAISPRPTAAPVATSTPPLKTPAPTISPKPTVSLSPVSVTNGEIIVSPLGSRDCVAPLEIETSGINDYYIYLHAISNGNGTEQIAHKHFDNMAFYVEGGKSAEVYVPLGEYEIYYATGNTWYGKSLKFGTGTRYYKCDDTFVFSENGDYYEGWTLTLYGVANGNMDTDLISASEFPG